MKCSSFRDFLKDIDFKFSLCFVKRNKIVNAKSLSMLLIVILTIGSSIEIIRQFAVWAARPKRWVFMTEIGMRGRPSIGSWLFLLPLLLSSLLAATGIIARRGELLVTLVVSMVLYALPLFYFICSMQQLRGLDSRLMFLFAIGSILVILHFIFILIAAKNEIDREVDEVFSIGKSMEFSETEVGFIRHSS